MQLLNNLITKLSFKANLEGHFFVYNADRFSVLENIVEFCVNLPVWGNLGAKSTKVARLGKFK